MIQFNDEQETITVILDFKGNDRRIRPFYCVRCGKCVCEITSQAKVVLSGNPSIEELADLNLRTKVRCNGTIYLGKDNRVQCTAKYIF